MAKRSSWLIGRPLVSATFRQRMHLRRRRRRLVAIEQPLTENTVTIASVSTQEVWQEARSVAGRVIVPRSASGCRGNVSTHQRSSCMYVVNIILPKRASDYRRRVPHIKDPHSFWAQLSVLFEHQTVFARTFFFFVLKNRLRTFQVQSSCVVLDVHARTCWSTCWFLPFWVPDKISDGSYRSL